MRRKKLNVKAALEQHPDLLERIQLAWLRWVPEQRRSYLRGLFLLELSDKDALEEGKFLMDMLKHYG